LLSKTRIGIRLSSAVRGTPSARVACVEEMHAEDLLIQSQRLEVGLIWANRSFESQDFFRSRTVSRRQVFWLRSEPWSAQAGACGSRNRRQSKEL